MFMIQKDILIVLFILGVLYKEKMGEKNNMGRNSYVTLPTQEWICAQQNSGCG